MYIYILYTVIYRLIERKLDIEEKQHKKQRVALSHQTNDLNECLIFGVIHTYISISCDCEKNNFRHFGITFPIYS